MFWWLSSLASFLFECGYEGEEALGLCGCQRKRVVLWAFCIKDGTVVVCVVDDGIQVASFWFVFVYSTFVSIVEYASSVGVFQAEPSGAIFVEKRGARPSFFDFVYVMICQDHVCFSAALETFCVKTGV
jgi:hypothetical protein